jgi:hypothetical protein
MDNVELLGQLLARLEEITDVKVQLSSVVTTLASLVASQEMLASAIRGNGKPGLNDRVRDLEFGLEDHKMHCPLASVVEDLQREHKSEEERVKTSELEKKERIKENRQWRWGLLAAILMLALSTAVNLILITIGR